MLTETQKKARRERYDYGNEHWVRGGTTGPVVILEAFGAIPVRKGDRRSDVRNVENLEPGDVVELTINPEPNSPQSREQVASWYAKEMFEPTDEELTDHDAQLGKEPEERRPPRPRRRGAKQAEGKQAEGKQAVGKQAVGKQAEAA